MRSYKNRLDTPGYEGDEKPQWLSTERFACFPFYFPLICFEVHYLLARYLLLKLLHIENFLSEFNRLFENLSNYFSFITD